MSDFHKAIMNIPIFGAEYGFCGVVDPEYSRGHRDALVAASKIALDADVRVNRLETELAAAQAEMQAMVSRLTKLAKEFQTEETWDGKRNDALRYCADRLRETISGEGER